MDELKDIVTNLELSKKLKEKGFPQDTLFSYYQDDTTKEWTLVKIWVHSDTTATIAAPTSEELLQKLYPQIDVYPYSYKLNIVMLDKGEKSLGRYFSIGYERLVGYLGTGSIRNRDSKGNIVLPMFGDLKLCNALAMLYNYLADNKLLEGK